MNQNCAIVTMHPVPYTPVQSSPARPIVSFACRSFDRQTTERRFARGSHQYLIVVIPLHVLMEHASPLSRTVTRIPTLPQTALSLAMRTHSAMFPLARHSIDHRPRARSPHAPSLIVVPERIPRLLPSAMHLLIIPTIQLPLNRPTASPLLRDPPNTNTSSTLAVSAPAIRSRVRVLQSQFLLLVVSSLIGLVAYTRIPRFIRVQSAEPAPIPPSVRAEGGRLVCAAGRALVAQRVPFVGDPACDAGRRGRGGVVGGWVVAAGGGAIEGVEAGWWEA
jgi:hypothetical protein